jgi:hypothetical protein
MDQGTRPSHHQTRTTQDSWEDNPHWQGGRGEDTPTASRKNNGVRSEAGYFSCRGKRETLGTQFDPLPALRSGEAGANHRSVGVR